MGPDHARTTRPDRQARGRLAGWGAGAAVATAVGIGALSTLDTPGDVAALGLLAAVPFLAATLSTTVWTIASGVMAAGVAIGAGDRAHALWDRDMRILLTGIAAATVLAVSTAVVRGRRLRQLHNTRVVADVVQSTLLRPVPKVVDDTAVAAHYTSATRGADVGGDIYEVLATPFGLRVFVGDVRGKGLPAVRLASAALGAFREWCYSQPTLTGLARQLDASIARNADLEEFVTAVLLQVNQDDVELANCGHPPPLLRHDGAVTEIEPAQASLPLGLGVSAESHRVPFGPGDRLLLYTDGASEARRHHRFFDVSAEFARLGDKDADELVELLHRRLVKFTRRRLADDVAILLLERRGPAAPEAERSPGRRFPVAVARRSRAAADGAAADGAGP